MRLAGRIVAEVLALVEESLDPGASTAELDRLAEEHIRAAAASLVPGLPGGGATTRGPARLSGLDVHLPRRRDRPRHPRRPGDQRGPDRLGRRRRHLRRLAWRRRPQLHLRRRSGRTAAVALQATRLSLMAGIAAAVTGNRIGHISGAVEDVARRRGLRHHPPVRGSRHRHVDARGPAGPQLPLASPGIELGRPLPGHRADAHARLGGHRGARRPLDGGDPRTGRCPPTSNTPSP